MALYRPGTFNLWTVLRFFLSLFTQRTRREPDGTTYAS
jgi:hypothetical protein